MYLQNESTLEPLGILKLIRWYQMGDQGGLPVLMPEGSIIGSQKVGGKSEHPKQDTGCSSLSRDVKSPNFSGT